MQIQTTNNINSTPHFGVVDIRPSKGFLGLIRPCDRNGVLDVFLRLTREFCDSSAEIELLPCYLTYHMGKSRLKRKLIKKPNMESQRGQREFFKRLTHEGIYKQLASFIEMTDDIYLKKYLAELKEQYKDVNVNVQGIYCNSTNMTRGDYNKIKKILKKAAERLSTSNLKHNPEFVVSYYDNTRNIKTTLGEDKVNIHNLFYGIQKYKVKTKFREIKGRIIDSISKKVQQIKDLRNEKNERRKMITNQAFDAFFHATQEALDKEQAQIPATIAAYEPHLPHDKVGKLMAESLNPVSAPKSSHPTHEDLRAAAGDLPISTEAEFDSLEYAEKRRLAAGTARLQLEAPTPKI